VRRIVFAAPAAVAWPLPIYELALLTAAHLAERGATGVEIVLATLENRPLGLFGAAASEAAAGLLEHSGIRVETAVAPRCFAAVGCSLRAAGRSRPTRWSRCLDWKGLGWQASPAIATGSSRPTSTAGWFTLTDVYAAGDITVFPVKQGGIATQQAHAAATAIASDAGAAVRPATFRPVLRGLLMTGRGPRFLRAEIGPHRSIIDVEPLWWPPAKIVGRYLAPFLAQQLGIPAEPPAPTTTPSWSRSNSTRRPPRPLPRSAVAPLRRHGDKSRARLASALVASSQPHPRTPRNR
jgi:sulfide:quinone oxidoreductase